MLFVEGIGTVIQNRLLTDVTQNYTQ